MEGEINYKTKSFITRNALIAVILMLQVGLGALFLAIFLDLGQFWSVLLFMGSMAFIAALLGGKTVYSISKHGISRVVTPYLLKMFNFSQKQSYEWNDIEWFKAGTDMNREMREYRYLTIKFKGIGNQWKIDDKSKDDKAFETFRESFIQIVEAYDKSVETAGARIVTHGQAFDKHGIKRKKTFYETALAKVVTVLVSILLLSLITFYYFYSEYLNASNLYKLLLIVVPGWFYLVFRVFVKKETN